jgi:hypothetical protein
MGNFGWEKKKTARASVPYSKEGLLWAAGLLEGEGSFHRGTTTEVVSCAQVDTWVTDKLLKLFGGSLYRKRNTSGSEQVQWQVNGGRARGLMMTLYTLLSPRRQAQIARALG